MPASVGLSEAESEDSSEQQEPMSDVQDSQETEQPVSPLNPPDSPLAMPAKESSQALPPLEIVHDEESGSVMGQLIFVDENGERPVEGIILALGTMLKDENGLQIIVSYKVGIAPSTVTDEHGRFIFNEVKPDTYGMILDAVMASSLLNYPDQDMSFVFDVTANEVIDLGELQYDELPAPGYTK